MQEIFSSFQARLHRILPHDTFSDESVMTCLSSRCFIRPIASVTHRISTVRLLRRYLSARGNGGDCFRDDTVAKGSGQDAAGSGTGEKSLVTLVHKRHDVRCNSGSHLDRPDDGVSLIHEQGTRVAPRAASRTAADTRRAMSSSACATISSASVVAGFE